MVVVVGVGLVVLVIGYLGIDLLIELWWVLFGFVVVIFSLVFYFSVL